MRRLFVEEGRGRPRALWRLLAQLVLTAAFSLLLGGLALGTLTVLGAPALGRPSSSGPASFSVQGVVSLLAMLLSVWLAGRLLDRRPFGDFGFHMGAGWWLDLLFGMALGALLMSAIFFLELALGWVSVGGTFETTTPGTPFALALLAPVVLFLCVGIYEETFSRGYQLKNIAEGLNYPTIGPRGAVLLSFFLTSSFFGLLHLGNPNATLLSTLNIALAGLLLGLGYVLTGELAIPIGLHITWNFFQGNVYGFPVSGTRPIGAPVLSTQQAGPDLLTGGVFGPEAGLLGVGAMLTGAALIALWVRLRAGKLAVHTPIAEGPAPTTPRADTR